MHCNSSSFCLSFSFSYLLFFISIHHLSSPPLPPSSFAYSSSSIIFQLFLPSPSVLPSLSPFLVSPHFFTLLFIRLFHHLHLSPPLFSHQSLPPFDYFFFFSPFFFHFFLVIFLIFPFPLLFFFPSTLH